MNEVYYTAILLFCSLILIIQVGLCQQGGTSCFPSVKTTINSDTLSGSQFSIDSTTDVNSTMEKQACNDIENRLSSFGADSISTLPSKEWNKIETETKKLGSDNVGPTVGKFLNSADAFQPFSNLSIVGDLKKKTPIVSHINLMVSSSLGYQPFIDSSNLISGYSHSYWVQTSAHVFGLPVSFQFNSTHSGISSNLPFNFQQYHFDFDYQQFIEDLKSELIKKVGDELAYKRDQLLAFNYVDSLNLFTRLKDTLANMGYQLYINQMRDEKERILDSLKRGLQCDSTAIRKIDHEIDVYNKYQKAFGDLSHFQEKFYPLQQKFSIDSALSQKNISSLRSINSSDDLLQEAKRLGVSFDKKLWPLNFRQLSFGSQLLDHTPLTFYNYYSNGLAVTYNDSNYIIRTAIVSDHNPFTNYHVLGDSLIFPNEFGKKVFLLGLGKGNIDKDYSLFTTSFITDKKKNDQGESFIPDPNKWLLSFYEQFIILKKIKLSYEFGKTMVKENQSPLPTNSIENFISKSAAFSHASYEIKKIKSEFLIESSFIGISYYTHGNPNIQPGTANISVGWKQYLFHQKLMIDYKLFYTTFLYTSSQKNTQWYQLAQLSYRLGHFVTLSGLISPFQFAYHILQTDSVNRSHSEYINFNAALNVPLGRRVLIANLNFSNYAYQNSLVDTAFSSNTKQVSCYLATVILNHQFSAVGHYFIPKGSIEQTVFVNSFEITGSVVQNRWLRLAIGPKWLGYDRYSDQLGGTMQLNASLGKYFNWDMSVEKYLNVERDKLAYGSTVFFTTDLTFKL